MAKAVKKTKQGILDKVRVPVFTSSFKVKTIALKDLRWTMEMVVQDILPKSHHYYKMVLSFDEEPFKLRVDSLQRTIDSINGKSVSLFGEDDKDKKNRIKAWEDEMATVTEDREEKRRNCPQIEFTVTVDKVDWSKNSSTILKVGIPDDVIPELNKRKVWFSLYKVELEPTD